MWSTYVHEFSSLLAHLAGWLDGSWGLAILLLAMVVRMVLLPMTLRTAEQNWLRQLKLQALQPKLERLRQRHADDPMAYAKAARELHRQHGITTGIGASLLVALVQAPLGIGVYAAVRQGAAKAGSFLWISKLARPDLLLALAVTGLALATMLLNPMLPEQARTLLQWLPVVMTFFVVWHLSAALVLYYAGSSSVGVLQAMLLRRRIGRHHALITG